MPSQSQLFKYALVQYLADYDEYKADHDNNPWCDYKHAMDIAFKIGQEEFGVRENLVYSTRKNARADLLRKGFIEQRRKEQEKKRGMFGSFEMRITEKGRKAAKKLEREGVPEDKVEKVVVPEPPFRIGKGHMLPPRTWRAVVDLVQTGRYDLVVISHDTKTKTGYWDA